MRGGDDRGVQRGVGLDELVDPATAPGRLAVGERGVERRQVRGGTPQRGQPGRLHLEGAAHLDHLGHPVVGEPAGHHRGQLVGGHHVRAGALPALQHPGVHQRADRLADGVAAHAERGDQLRLGGDAPADRPLAAEDARPELLDRLPDPVAARRHVARGIDRRWHWLHHLPEIHPMIVGSIVMTPPPTAAPALPAPTAVPAATVDAGTRPRRRTRPPVGALVLVGDAAGRAEPARRRHQPRRPARRGPRRPGPLRRPWPASSPRCRPSRSPVSARSPRGWSAGSRRPGCWWSPCSPWPSGRCCGSSPTRRWSSWLTSALALAGIAVANILLPMLVKQHFPHRTGLVTGAYTMALTVGTTVAAASAVPIAHAFGSWRAGLGVWAGLAAVAVLPWVPLALRARAAARRATPTAPVAAPGAGPARPHPARLGDGGLLRRAVAQRVRDHGLAGPALPGRRLPAARRPGCCSPG